MNTELKIHMKRPEFFVSGKNIVCSLVCTFADRYFCAYGSAKCSDDDKFDYNLGSKLARVRAEKNAYKTARRMAVKDIKRQYESMKNLEAFVDKANRCITHDEVYIIDLLKD